MVKGLFLHWVNEMKIKSIIITLLLLIQSSLLFGQKNEIIDLSYTVWKNEIQCRITSIRKVPFGSIWLPDDQRLVVYLRESVWVSNQEQINPEFGPVKSVFGRQSKNDPSVVEIIIDFIETKKYAINYLGNDVIVSIEKNTKSRPSIRNVSAKDRIERRGLDNNKKISMDYREADLPNILRLLAQQNNVNIVAGSDVTGNITISLRNVTLREALDNILFANGYDYILDGNVILVKLKEQFIASKSQTKIYRLKYIDAENLKSVIKDMVSDDAKIHVLVPDFFTSVQASQGGIDNDKGKGPLASLTGGGSGIKSKEKKRSSILVVTESPGVIRKIDDIIAKLDVAAPQILIEAKLVELSPIDKSNLGIDWDKSISAKMLYQELLPSGETRDYSAINPDVRQRGNWSLGHLSADQFSAVLNYLQENTESKLISNPNILAMDNVTATISVGTNFPIPQINRGVGGQGDIVTFNYKDVAIVLNVTPHVTENDEIIMHVNPVIEEITGQVSVDGNSAPITSKRSVSTVVTVKDGDTVVIGGMIKEGLTKTVSKVFLLGDIPILGKLFRNTKYEKRQTDLLIFITPHIIP